MEGWKEGRMEGWKAGRKDGRMEGRKEENKEIIIYSPDYKKKICLHWNQSNAFKRSTVPVCLPACRVSRRDPQTQFCQ